jgi:hypothetical protein
VLAYLTKPLDLAELQTVLVKAGAGASARQHHSPDGRAGAIS